MYLNVFSDMNKHSHPKLADSICDLRSGKTGAIDHPFINKELKMSPGSKH